MWYPLDKKNGIKKETQEKFTTKVATESKKFQLFLKPTEIKKFDSLDLNEERNEDLNEECNFETFREGKREEREEQSFKLVQISFQSRMLLQH